MKTRYWHIVGYESLEKIYERKVKVGSFSNIRMQELLMALAARGGLSYDEIVGAYAAKNAKIRNALLEVRKDRGQRPSYSCGESPWFTAEVVEDDA